MPAEILELPVQDADAAVLCSDPKIAQVVICQREHDIPHQAVGVMRVILKMSERCMQGVEQVQSAVSGTDPQSVGVVFNDLCHRVRRE